MFLDPKQHLSIHWASPYVVKAAILGYQLNDTSIKDAAIKCMVELEISLKELQDWENLEKYPELMSEMFENYSSAMIYKSYINS